MKFLTSFQKGFSLIEVVVAIAIASAAYVAILGLNSTTVKTSSSNRDQSIGTGLANEGVEALRSIRKDSRSVLWGGVYNDWNSVFFGAITVPNNFAFRLVFGNPSNPQKWLLEQPLAGELFDVADNPYFKRRVIMINPAAPTPTPPYPQIKIFRVEVCWGDPNVARCFSNVTNPDRVITQVTKLGAKSIIVE